MRFAEPASNLNSNEFYSNSKLKHTSTQKHNAGSMNATINYIKPKMIYQLENNLFTNKINSLE
jgi:hypothetical protein